MSDLYGIKEFGYLQKGLDARLAKQNMSAANIANAETPGYKEKRVVFSDQLAVAVGDKTGIDTTHPAHISNQTPVVETVLDTPRIDGNTVDLDRVGVENSMNATEFALLTTVYKRRSKQLISAATGR